MTCTWLPVTKELRKEEIWAELWYELCCYMILLRSHPSHRQGPFTLGYFSRASKPVKHTNAFVKYDIFVLLYFLAFYTAQINGDKWKDKSDVIQKGGTVKNYKNKFFVCSLLKSTIIKVISCTTYIHKISFCIIFLFYLVKRFMCLFICLFLKPPWTLLGASMYSAIIVDFKTVTSYIEFV